MKNRILVLSDGESYTQVAGCVIMTLTPEGMKRLDQGYSIRDLLRENQDYEFVEEVQAVGAAINTNPYEEER